MVSAVQQAHRPGLSGARAGSLSEFRNLASSSFVPLAISAEQSLPFSGRMTSADADDIVFTEVAAHAHLVERTPETIAAGGSGYYKVSLLLAGRSILVQDGREVIMNPGDLSVYDTSRPYSLLFEEEFRNLIMMFPKDRLELPIPFTEQLTAVSLGAEHPALAPVVKAFLSQFPAQLATLEGRVRDKIAHTSLDLMGTLFSSILDADPAARDPHQVMLQKITRYIDANLSRLPIWLPAASRRRTTSRPGTCTRCSIRPTPPSRPGSASVASNAAATTSSIPSSPTARFPRSPRAGVSPTPLTSAACSKPPTGCHRANCATPDRGLDLRVFLGRCPSGFALIRARS